MSNLWVLTQVGLGISSDRVIKRLVEVVEDGIGVADNDVGLVQLVSAGSSTTG